MKDDILNYTCFSQKVNYLTCLLFLKPVSNEIVTGNRPIVFIHFLSPLII